MTRQLLPLMWLALAVSSGCWSAHRGSHVSVPTSVAPVESPRVGQELGLVATSVLDMAPISGSARRITAATIADVGSGAERDLQSGWTAPIRQTGASDPGRSNRPVTQVVEDPPPAPAPLLEASPGNSSLIATEASFALDAAHRPLRLNLPTSLAMINGQHPAVGIARWKVQEAYARLDQAKVLWLPSLQPGISLHRHDGNYQASNGQIVDVNRSSIQYGLGSGATGAGTVPRPGLAARFHLADALLLPEVREKQAWADGHAANAVMNRQMLEVALAYLALVESQQQLKIVDAARERLSELSRLTEDYAQTGQGSQADADRVRTELRLVENRVVESRELAEVASSALAETLSLDADRLIMPMDLTVVPLDLVPAARGKAELIQTGLAHRPELKEVRALVAAASDQLRRERMAPLIPSVLLGMSVDGFGGGVGSRLDAIDGRYDFDALLSWEIRQLGFGEKAARKEARAGMEQARFRQLKKLDQVAHEVATSHTRTVHRRRRIEVTRLAIEDAEQSFDRNLGRIRDGQGLPLEVLQSARALEAAHQAYLTAVVAHNEAQFELQWSLGWPVFDPSANDSAD